MESMPFRAEWGVVAARIDGFLALSTSFYRSLENRSSDDFGMLRKVLFPEAEANYEVVLACLTRHEASLPVGAAKAVTEFMKPFGDHFRRKDKSGTIDTNLPFLQVQVAVLSSASTQISYYMSGGQQQLRLLADRAFVHLHRCIVADPDFKAKWQKAFASGETSCEALGAVHLLWHGIGTFKANAAGGRTDLILGSRIDNQTAFSSAGLGLVLTEWKRITKLSEAKAAFAKGIEQASLYKEGALAGVELEEISYVVVVSEKAAEHIEDIEKDSRRYRYVNVAVNPDMPSIQAAKT